MEFARARRLFTKKSKFWGRIPTPCADWGEIAASRHPAGNEQVGLPHVWLTNSVILPVVNYNYNNN